jgi:hypothetical protein
MDDPAGFHLLLMEGQTMYKMTATLATPNYDADEDVVYELDLADKKALHKVEKGFVNALHVLVKLTADELDTGKKEFTDGNRQLMTLTVDISKDGADYGGYMHRWPNQSDMARNFIRGLLDGLMKEAGHAGRRKAKSKRG